MKHFYCRRCCGPVATTPSTVQYALQWNQNCLIGRGDLYKESTWTSTLKPLCQRDVSDEFLHHLRYEVW